MSAQNIFYGLVTPMIYMVACLLIGYCVATESADVCKIQIEKAKKALHYESLLTHKEEANEVKAVAPMETNEAR